MPRITYHDLSLDVPEGWEDGTIVNLQAPEPAPVSLPVVQPVVRVRPTIVMTRVTVKGLDPNLESYALAQEKILAQLMERCEVIARGDASVGEGEHAVPAVMREFSFNGPDGGLQQVHIYFQVGQVFFTLTGTGALDADFAGLREQIMALAKSMRPS